MTWCCVHDLQFALTAESESNKRRSLTFLRGIFLNERSVETGRFKFRFHETAYVQTLGWKNKEQQICFSWEPTQLKKRTSFAALPRRVQRKLAGYCGPLAIWLRVELPAPMAPLKQTFKRIFIQTLTSFEVTERSGIDVNVNILIIGINDAFQWRCGISGTLHLQWSRRCPRIV